MVRSIDRSELYIADEVFLCGTGAQISPVTSIDHRPIGTGEIGPVTAGLSKAYFDAVRGRNPAYSQLADAGLLTRGRPATRRHDDGPVDDRAV